MKRLSKLTISLIAALIVPLFALPSHAEVQVTFSKYLTKRMDRITASDLQREKVFRQFREEGTRTTIAPHARLNRSIFGETVWGNERLVPDIEDYSVPALIEAAFERGIKKADPDFDGKVELHIKRMSVRDFAVAAIAGQDTQMKGVIKMFDGEGNLLAEHEVWSAIIPQYSAGMNYTGPHYAYRQAALHTRVGPIVAEFSQKALKRMYPDFDAPGLVIIER